MHRRVIFDTTGHLVARAERSTEMEARAWADGFLSGWSVCRPSPLLVYRIPEDVLMLSKAQRKVLVDEGML